MCVYGCVTTAHTHTYWTEADPALQTARQRKKEKTQRVELIYDIHVLYTLSLSRLV
jgi:alpha-ketoglutarate-dependent taurine dioxygenase